MKATKPARDCAACLYAASALPGAPMVCTFQRLYRSVEIARDVRGQCGKGGKMWKERHGSES